MTKDWVDDMSDDVWGDKKTGTATVKPIGTDVQKNEATTPSGHYETGMRAISDLATGKSPIYKSLENRTMQDYGGGAMAAIGASKQEAAQAGLGKESIGSVTRRVTRDLEGERSKLLGDIAARKQAIAAPAATQLVSGAMQGRQQELAEKQQEFTEGMTERQQTFAEKQYSDIEKQNEWNRMLQYYDPSTPEGLRSLQSAYTSLFGGRAPDLNQLTEQREYARQKQQQDVQMGEIGITQQEQATKDQRYSSMMSRVAGGTSIDRINEEFGENFTQEDYDQMWQSTDQYFRSRGLDMSEASLYGYTDENGNHVMGGLEIAAGRFGLEGETLEEHKKEMWGWTDDDGVYHEGRYDFLSEQDKRAADAMYGYDVVVDGETQHIMGTLELQNDAADIQRQGLDITRAQTMGYLSDDGWVKGSIQIAAEKAGLEVSSLYGYTYNSETGEIVTDPAEISRLGDRAVRVDGALILAGKKFGLAEDTIDMQRQEMFGYTDDDGNYIRGRIELLNDSDVREARQLWGWEETLADGTTVTHRGTLDMMADELLIKKQGMTLDEARLFGYEKDGEHISGSIEIASRQMDIITADNEKMESNEAGVQLSSHLAKMANLPGYDWRTDEQAEGYLQDYWEAVGKEGVFDEDWADRQFQASTITESDAAINQVLSSDWYKTMEEENPERAERVRRVINVAAYLNVTQGLTPTFDDEGQITGLVDSENNTVWSEAEPTEEGPERQPGEIYTDDTGRVFRVGAGGKETEIVFDIETDDIWGVRADSVVSLGEENNPYYNEIMQSRVKEILDGTFDGNKIIDEKTYEEALSAADEWVPDSSYQEGSARSTFKNAPAVGSIIRYDGVLYRVTTEPTNTTYNNQHIRLMDLKTGTEMVFGSAGEGFTN